MLFILGSASVGDQHVGSRLCVGVGRSSWGLGIPWISIRIWVGPSLIWGSGEGCQVRRSVSVTHLASVTVGGQAIGPVSPTPELAGTAPRRPEVEEVLALLVEDLCVTDAAV